MSSRWEELAAQTPGAASQSDAPVLSKWENLAGETPQQHGAGGSFEKTPWGEVLKGAAVNAPQSAMRYGQNIYSALRHPIETGKAVGRTFAGAAQGLLPGDEPYEYEKYYVALEDAMIERYGNLESFKETVATDPVGTLADVSSVVLPAAQGAKAVGAVKTAGRLQKVAGVLDPVGAVSTVARKGASALVPRRAPSRLYEGAVKFSTTLPTDVKRRMVNTALTEQIMPTYSGLKKLDTKVTALNDKVVSAIERAVAERKAIPVDDMFKGFADARNDIMKISGEPLKGAKAFVRVEEEIREANATLGRAKLTPLEAQKMKQRIYKEMKNEYTRLSVHPVNKEAQMAVAKNLKESIENIIPEVKQLNADESVLLELRGQLERAAERISNRDLLSLGTTAKAAGGGVAFGKIGLATGLTLGLLDSQPLIKSKLALVLAKLKEKGVKVRPTVLGTRLGLYQAGRLQNAQQNKVPGVVF